GFRMRSATAPWRRLYAAVTTARNSPHPTSAQMTLVRVDGRSGVAPATVSGRSSSCVTASVLTEAVDEVRGRAVRIEPACDEVPRTHPPAPGPLPERQSGARGAGCRGHHLHPFERFLDAAGRQRMCVGERVQQHGREVTVHDWDAVLGPAPVRRLVLVE